MENVTKNKNIDGYKIALAVRQLVKSECLHESSDIEGKGIESILQLYGIFYKWTDEEKAIIREELIEMATKKVIKDEARLTERVANPFILSIPDRPIPNPVVIDLKTVSIESESKAQKSIVDKSDYKASSNC